MNTNEKRNGSLIDQVCANLNSAGAFGTGGRIVVAISGGQDSCALLHALVSLREELGLKLHAAHLNHSLRGEESDQDATFATAFADALGVDCTVERCDVTGLSRRLHLTKHEAARLARFEFLNRVAEREGADWIAVGHTKDDHVETILLNTLRGSGTDGLKGLPLVSGNILRPLLGATRADTEAYCIHNDIAFRIDSSNLSYKYMRNRVRTELLPELETYYNPAVRESLVRLAEIASSEADFMDVEAKAALIDLIRLEDGDRLELPCAELALLHPAIQRRVIRLAVASIQGDLKDVGFEEVERIFKSVTESRSLAFQLPGGRTKVEIGTERVVFSRDWPARRWLPFAYRVNVPGQTILESLGIRVDASFGPKPADSDGGAQATIDYAAMKLPLEIRTRRPGDRIQPLGMKGTKKVQDVMVDRKIPSRWRDSVPIITDSEGPIWIVGHMLSDRVRIGRHTETVLTLWVSPLD